MVVDPSGNELEVVRLGDRPDLVDAMWALGPEVWPDFMMEDPVGNLYDSRVTGDFAVTFLLVLDGGEVVARAVFVPFTRDDQAWDDLPDRGWDAIIERGVADHDAGREPDAASALEIGIAPSHRGRGLSRFVLDAMRREVSHCGLLDLVAPVRPSSKHSHPHQPMDDFVARTTDEGLPHDPWLRTHVRAGGRIVKVAPASMRIEATVAEWESWLGASLEAEGSLVVDDALVPLQIDREADHVVYVEPNVWVHHDLRGVPVD